MSKRQFAVHFGNSPFKSAPLAGPGLAHAVLPVLALLGLAALIAFHPESSAVLAVVPLVAKREELKAKQAALAAVWEAAGPERDMTKVKKFGDVDWADLSTVAKVEEIRKANDEMTELGKEVEQLAELDRMANGTKRLGDRLKGHDPLPHPAPGDPADPPRGIKALGDHLGESKLFADWQEQRKGGSNNPVSIELEDVYPSEILTAHKLRSGGMLAKTLFETSAGWAPESTRIPRLVEAATRPIEILDLIPMERTGQAAIVYMEETTRTHSAAEKAEGVAYAESVFALTEKTSTVRKITDSVPVTDEQLDDVQQVRGYLSDRLMFGVRQRLDGQALSGNGTPPNLAGILNTAGIQTQAKGTDPTPDAFYKAMTLIRVTGRAEPSGIVMHANDWQAIRLLKTADGIYIWGSPSEAGPSRMWGLPVAQTTQSENTGLVGDFANFCALFERSGVVVEVGYVGDQFKEGKRTLRAQMRAAFVVFRPAAFCSVTGI